MFITLNTFMAKMFCVLNIFTYLCTQKYNQARKWKHWLKDI